jgi:hypothetical protein
MVMAVALVLIFTASAGYHIRKAPPLYQESATVIFYNAASRTAPDAYSSLAPSLIASGAVIAQLMMNKQTQGLVRAAGGTSAYSISLINLYNEDYPDYNNPAATLAADSPSPAIAHRTFLAAVRILDQLLTVRQAQAGAPRRDQISAQIVGDTGPVSQTGSALRVYAGLALLAAAGAAVACGFLGRRDARGNAADGPPPGPRDQRQVRLTATRHRE